MENNNCQDFGKGKEDSSEIEEKTKMMETTESLGQHHPVVAVADSLVYVTHHSDLDDASVAIPQEGGGGETYKTYAQLAKEEQGMLYTVSDVPPLLMSIGLGMQHVLTLLGATLLAPTILMIEIGASKEDTAAIIATNLVVSGINTLVQTTIGDRLPIVQSSSFTYLATALTIANNPTLASIEDPSERFTQTILVLQGAIICVGIMQIFIGYTGLFVPLIKYIGPLTIASVITAIGLGLFNLGFSSIASCWALGLTQLFTTVLFSQYLKRMNLGRWNVFALFPIILAIAVSWSLGAILTAADVWPEGSPCRTDSVRPLLAQTPIFRIPYPFQWGAPIFKSYAVVPMIGAMLAGMIESIGDYYSCAKLSGAPPPTAGIIARGQAGEGIGVLVAGFFGTGNGTTSYSENIGAISITSVGSRAVVQVAAVIMIIMGLFTKISALFASIPGSIYGGIYCVVFGLIVAVGLSNLQYVDLNSERNLFILGFSIFNSLSIAGPGGYFSQVGNPFGNSNGGLILYSLFSSPMIVALICSFILDNTIPGTRKERGLHVWDKVRGAEVNLDEEYVWVYSLPLGFAKVFRNCNYLEYMSLGRMPLPPRNGVYKAGRGDIGDLCCPCLCRKDCEDEEHLDADEDEEIVEL